MGKAFHKTIKRPRAKHCTWHRFTHTSTPYQPSEATCCGTPFISRDWGILLNVKIRSCKTHSFILLKPEVWNKLGKTLIPNAKPN